MNRFGRLGVAGVLLCCGTAAAFQEQSYNIKMNRAVEVGQKMVVYGTGSVEMAMTAALDGKAETLDKTRQTVAFESEATVLEVDELGRPTRIGHKIRLCELTDDKGVTVIAPKKSTLTARRGRGKTIFHVEGRTVDPMHQAALELVAGLDTDGPTHDVLFGTPQRRTVGEKWSINNKALAEEFSRYSPHPVGSGDIAGDSKLLKITEQRGYPCEVIHTRISARNSLPGVGMLPPSLKIKRAKLDAQYYMLLPLDEVRPKMGEAMSMNLDLVFTTTMGERRAFVDARINAKLEGRRAFVPMLTPNEIAISRARERN